MKKARKRRRFGCIVLATKAAEVEILVYYLAVVKCARYFARVFPAFFLPAPIRSHAARVDVSSSPARPIAHVFSGSTNV